MELLNQSSLGPQTVVLALGELLKTAEARFLRVGDRERASEPPKWAGPRRAP